MLREDRNPANLAHFLLGLQTGPDQGKNWTRVRSYSRQSKVHQKDKNQLLQLPTAARSVYISHFPFLDSHVQPPV